MDVITVSSGSEGSDDEGIQVKNTSVPGASNWFDEDYCNDWDNDGVSHSVNYDSESPEKAAKQSDLENEIEDFITPAKEKSSSLTGKTGRKSQSKNNKILDTTSTLAPEISSQGYFSSDSSNSPSKIPKNKTQSQKRKLTPEQKEENRIIKQQNKSQREKEREAKKLEQLKQKAYKAAFAENQRNLKPEENIKFLKVHIDNKIINSEYGGNIISLLQQNNIQFAVEEQAKSYTILWSKRKVEKVVDDTGALMEQVENKEENQLLYVLDWQKAVKLIKNDELLTDVETVKSIHADKNLTLVIYGLEKYFNYKKSKKCSEKKKLKVKDFEREFEDAPGISREELEFALVDLQLLGKHNCRLLETPDELAGLVYNFTKSLSQVDYKLEKQKAQDDLGFYAVDASQSVKVDKNGNGLLRLWQQQICQFSSVGLETAQAIVSHYNSPLALMTQYEKCESVEEGELLLQNIQIRRDAGVLSTTRRVGPQLSKKIYKFFTSDDPDLEL